jgi:hypothetical protein
MSKSEYLARAQAAKVKLKAKLEGLPSCDKPGSDAATGRLVMCSWGCGRTTRNRTEIGDMCWMRRDEIHAERLAKPKIVDPKMVERGKRLAERNKRR